VLPDTNFGPMLDPATQGGSTAGFVRRIWEGSLEKLLGVAPRLSPFQSHPYFRESRTEVGQLTTKQSIS